MGKYIRGAVDEELALGTLATKTVISEAFDGSVNERTLVSSIIATYSMTNFTKALGDGPILVGIAHSDYSAAEIESFVENTASWNEGSKVEQEIADRLIRRIGVFDVPDEASDSVVLNDGKPMKKKLNWILLQGQTLQLWAYNLGTSSLETTSPVVAAQGHANLWPR